MAAPPLRINSELSSPSAARSGGNNNAIVIKEATTLNFGDLIQPYEGSTTNGGFGGAASRLVGNVLNPLDTLSLGRVPSANSILPLLVVGGIATGLFLFFKRRK